MISSENCQVHPSFQIGGIYKGNQNKYKIQRKVCMQCILQYSLPSDQILSKEDFVKKLQKRSDDLNLNKQLEESQFQLFLKTVEQQFDQIQEELSLILINMKDSIKRISEDQIAGDERFLQSINKQLNPFQCSQSELDYLINFLEGNIYEKWIQKKKIVVSQLKKVQGAFQKLVQNGYKISQLIDQIQSNFQDIFNIQSTNKKIQDNIIDLEGFENVNNKLIKTKFQLTTKRNGDKVYTKNTQILRIWYREKKILGSKKEEVILNLEQMKYLQFKGQYGIKGYKIKKWNYFWKGQNVGGGNFNLMGQKQGQWLELCSNYWDKRDIIEEGCYEKDKRIGDWNINWKNQRVGGGSYDKKGEGQKIGKWVELCERFCYDSQVIYRGQYYNGQKVGRWDILYKKEQIGGGSYDEEGNQVKLGNWVEIWNEFYDFSQVTYNGGYKNGKKTGRWDIWFNYGGNHKMQKQLIQFIITIMKMYFSGGGSYDKAGNEVKMGHWVEISNEFKNHYQVEYKGDYNNGNKVGTWEEMERNKFQMNEGFKNKNFIQYDN